jgi:Flp pilus assembly protein TadB
MWWWAVVWPLVPPGKPGRMARGDRPRRTREDYERGLPDYHDPTAGFGGAPPAYSALTLRAVLAAFGLVACLVGVVLFVAVGLTWAVVAFAVVAVVCAVDLGWVLYRKRRGEPG